MVNRTNKPKLHDLFINQTKYLLGMSRTNQYSLVQALHKKWPKNENDPNDDKYELPL